MRSEFFKLLTLLALVALPAGAADWTTSYASLARTSYLAGEAVAPPFALLWEYESDVKLKGAPLVAIGRTFLSDSAFHVWSLDLNDGTVAWKHDEARDPKEVKCYNAVNGNLKWTQAVDGKIIHTPQVGMRAVYVATDQGTLYAFSQFDGKKLWSVSLASPLTIAAADTNHVAIGSGSTLTVLRAKDGGVVFGVDLGGAIEEVPVITPDAVYAIAGSDVVAVNREGGEKWRHALPKEATTRLAVTKSGVLVGCADGSVRLIPLSGGAPLWEDVLAGVPSTVSGAGEVVYAGTQRGTLVGMQLADGAKLWSAALEHGEVDGVSLSAGRLLVTAGSWVGALIPAPAAPEDVSVTIEGGVANVSWAASAPNGGAISGYRVFRRRGANVVQVAVVSGDVLSFGQDPLPGNIGYSVSAIGVNGAESARSAEVTLAKGDPLVRRLRVGPVPLDPRKEDLSVSFELRAAARVTWYVVDAEGTQLTEERTENFPPGAVAITWEGEGKDGGKVEPGVYRVTLKAAAADENEVLARAFSVNWAFDSGQTGLPGGPAYTGAGPSPGVGGTGSSPGESPGTADGMSDTGGSGDNGVRDHGAGEGRDGHGQGKGKGGGPNR